MMRLREIAECDLSHKEAADELWSNRRHAKIGGKQSRCRDPFGNAERQIGFGSGLQAGVAPNAKRQ
jgi:hypothetical protein